LKSIGKYFPYGEDRTNPSPANPANGQEKFATYTRDAESGLDYAHQRCYTSGLGRFLNADRDGQSACSKLPQSFNRKTVSTGKRKQENGVRDLITVKAVKAEAVKARTERYGPNSKIAPSRSGP
jgi:RHS repeat-associated protein